MNTVTAGRKIVARRVTGKVGAVEDDKRAVRNMLASFYYAKVGAVVPDFTFRDGMLYTAVRAISARINQNWDAWPSNELATSYLTFLGKPIFVNHANFDPKRARGRVVAARYIESGKDKYVETIMEVDALRFPKLANEIRTGGLDSVSMGVEAGFTICSYCGNKATDVFDMCEHVKFHKGSHLLDTYTGEPKLVYENCLVTGTLVTMGDGTIRPIEDIQAGDLVLDHLGTPRTVLQAMSRQVDENTFRIHRQNNQIQAPQMTGNHPVLAIRGSAFGKDTFTRQGRLDRGLRPEFIEARELQVGDWVCETHLATDSSLVKILTADYTRQTRQHETCFAPVHTLPDTLELTEDLGRFIGLFLAEGSVNKALTQADFALHRDETHLADFVDYTARQVLGLTSITHAERNGGRTVTIFSSSLAQMLSHFGLGAANKALPDEFMSAPVDFLRGVVAGHEQGDGLHGEQFVQRHGHKHFTCSPKLAEQIYTIHVMLGNTPYHSTRQVRPDYEYPGKSPATWLQMHTVGFGNAGQKKVGRLSFGPWTFVRINEIDTIHYSGSVHNLEVADTHTYVAEGVAVHNCYKLGFFELSYVFDPADETAVVSKVIVASRKKAWGETEAPEDIDTLREDDDDSPDDYEFVTPYREPDEDMPFQNSIESPEELQTPDFDQTRRLDRDQEAEGLDDDRLVENVEEVGAPGAPGKQQQQQEAQPRAARKTRRMAMGRTKTRYAAEDEDSRPPWLNDDGGDEGGPPAPPPPPPADEGGGFDEGGDDGYDDEDESLDDGGGDLEDRIDQLEQAVVELQEEVGPPDDMAPEEEAPAPPMPPASPAGPPPQFASRRASTGRRRVAEDCDKDQDSDDDDKDDDKPPWLKEKESRRRTPQRPVNGRSPQKKGRKGTQKGAQTVGTPRLAERSKVAAASRGGRANNRRVADDSGHTDGGPYGENDLGEQAETFIPSVYGEGDGVPPAESVAAPTGDESKASNSETNLVARIQAKSQSLQRDISIYNQMQAQRQGGRRRHAEDSGVTQPTSVNPELSGTDDQSLKGDDFQDVGLDYGSSAETQPKDASRHWFAQFNNWLTQVTGQPWNYHNSGTLTRAAARWSKGSGVPLDALFPTLQTALRQAGKGEARSSSMRRRAEDEKLEVAAPDDRVDVEKPVSNETDADAQASQFDLGDFGGNAGDNLADPDLDVDSQIWAPGEGEAAAGGGDRSASREKFADGLTALRCAEAYIRCGLAPPQTRFKLTSWLQTIRHATVEDRANLLDAVYQANARAFAAARTPAGRTRGAAIGEIPPGFGSGRRVASTTRESALDPQYDALMWM